MGSNDYSTEATVFTKYMWSLDFFLLFCCCFATKFRRIICDFKPFGSFYLFTCYQVTCLMWNDVLLEINRKQSRHEINANAWMGMHLNIYVTNSFYDQRSTHEIHVIRRNWRCKTAAGQKSFVYRATSIWNGLSQDLINLNNLNNSITSWTIIILYDFIQILVVFH